MVEHYDSHPLAADSDDEKCFEEAEKKTERAANKCRWCNGSGIKKRSLFGGAGPSSRMREPSDAVPPPLLLPRTRKATTSSGFGAMLFLRTVWPPGKDVSRKFCVYF